MIYLKHIILTVLVCLSTVAFSQKNAQVLHLDKAGTLSSFISLEKASKLTHIKINGKINAVDFKYLRDSFIHLQEIDLSTVEIKNYVGKKGTLDQFHVYKANTIPLHAFSEKTDYAPKERTALQKVILPASLERIESFAFAYCPNLEILEFTGCEPPKLSDTALSPKRTVVFVPIGCKDIYLRNTDWAQYTVIDNEPVKVEVELGKEDNLANELLRKGYQAKNVHFLTVTGSVNFNDLKIIRDYMLDLIYIDLKNTDIVEIPDYTFAQKGYLQKIHLPNNLKSIGSNAFNNCTKLGPRLILPSSLTTISDAAFANCAALKVVEATGDKISVIGEDVFGENKTKKLVYKN